MKSIADTIQKIKENLNINIPNILAGNNLDNFDTYNIGYPTDQSKKFCSLRYRSGNRDNNNVFEFTIHLQLPQIEEIEAYKYIDALDDYMALMFNPYDYGFISFSYNIELIENFKTADTQAFFDVTMTSPIDDCKES